MERTGRTTAAGLAARAGEQVRLQGWLHRARKLSAVDFAVLRDRTGLAQVVLEDPATRQQLAALPEESVLDVVGRAVANAQAPGGVEVVDPRIEVLGEAVEPPPLPAWQPRPAAGLPVQLDHAALSWRHPARRRLWDVAAAAMAGFRSHLDAEGFTEVQTPKIVGTATETGATVFGLDYFGRQAYLAQSPQLYKQVLVGVFERVYEVGPVFRAEPHDTVRHLASYTSLDVELGFVRDHHDVVRVLRDVLASMVAAVADRVPTTDDWPAQAWPRVPDELPVVDFAEALRIAGAAPGEPDLAPADERAVGEWAAHEHGSDLVVVEGYPMAKRPFYTRPRPDDPRASNGFDLLFRGTELVTGGQRLHRHRDYLDALAERGEDPAAYAGYLEAFRHGMPPHGGFAIGLERFVARLCGVENVREVTLFPRDLHRLVP